MELVFNFLDDYGTIREVKKIDKMEVMRMYRMKKNTIGKIGIVILVIVFCLIFADATPFWSENKINSIQNMSVEDVELTILDEDTVQLENLIKGNDLLYSWTITTQVNGEMVSHQASNTLFYADYEVIEFYYENLDTLEFQAAIEYDGVMYISNTFVVSSDGDVAMSTSESTASTEEITDITRDISDIVSIAYIIFLIATVFLYYIVPKKFQWMVLLLASVFFYLLSGVQYLLFIILSSWMTFRVAKQMSRRKKEVDILVTEAESAKVKKQLKTNLKAENKKHLGTALIFTLGIMIIVKYTLFAIKNVNALLSLEIPLLQLIMPLGLSFYTFMLIAYLMDIYRGKYEAEENFGRFFLFSCFFPHVSQGPIARYNEVGQQFRENHGFKYQNFCFAAQRILWGFFVKLVIADRIATLVNGVYDSYTTQSWYMLIVGTLAYSIQVYADFYSCMEIAIGSAQLYGIQLGENFLRPYFSTTMPEFWRRWHVSLGTWFKDYVFYPISISPKLMKFSVKTRKKYGANTARILAAIPPIMGVWILTGLWHGSSWKFVAWGLFHGMLILLSTAFSQNVQNILVKFGVKTEGWDYKVFQMLKVFALCSIGRIFFRANSFMTALRIIKRMITFANPTGKVIDFSVIALDNVDYWVLGIALIMLLGVGIIQEKIGGVREQIAKANVGVRWLVWLVLIFGVVAFGVYGPGTAPIFIYEAF